MILAYECVLCRLHDAIYYANKLENVINFEQSASLHHAISSDATPDSSSITSKLDAILSRLDKLESNNKSSVNSKTTTSSKTFDQKTTSNSPCFNCGQPNTNRESCGVSWRDTAMQKLALGD